MLYAIAMGQIIMAMTSCAAMGLCPAQIYFGPIPSEIYWLIGTPEKRGEKLAESLITKPRIV